MLSRLRSWPIVPPGWTPHWHFDLLLAAADAPPARDARNFGITAEVLAQMRASIGALPPEEGGLLGGAREDGIVRCWFHDRTARRSGATYSPDTETVNRVLAEAWTPSGVRFLGFVHSHPGGLSRPSGGDEIYARRILAAMPGLERMLMPIVTLERGRFALHPWQAVRRGASVTVEPMALDVIDEAALPDADLDAEAAAAAARRIAEPNDPAFARVRGAYDLDRMARCRVIYVGVGGAAAFAEDLARAGVGEHVLIDGDTVALSNVATQAVYRRDVGRYKVEALAERLRDINPAAGVIALPRMLDAIGDAELTAIAARPIDGAQPLATLLCGLTDSFAAQARINRLALQVGLPALCAQVYREGRGAEVTFTHPETTPACQRCVLASRYRAHLERGYRNEVTSDGTPIFATTRLNAIKGLVAMALLHHGSGHMRWGGLLRRIGNRNLILVRWDPDLRDTLGIGAFDRAFAGADRERLLCDETLWLPQQPEPGCPDCGGTGDLARVVGRITREASAAEQRIG